MALTLSGMALASHTWVPLPRAVRTGEAHSSSFKREVSEPLQHNPDLLLNCGTRQRMESTQRVKCISRTRASSRCLLSCLESHSLERSATFALPEGGGTPYKDSQWHGHRLLTRSWLAKLGT
jgi:hypothetical protein